MWRTILLLAFLIIDGTQAARAATLPPLTTAYDADVSIDFGTTHLDSTVNAAGQKERHSFDTQTGKQTLIIRHDQGKAYLIIPALNVAMSMENGQIPGGYNLEMLQTVPVTVEGSDTVAGLKTTRYRVNGQTEQGSFDGHVWATAEGILMKVDGMATHEGKQTAVKISLANLHQRAQDASLFDVPASMKVVPYAMAQMLMKGMKNGSLSAQ